MHIASFAWVAASRVSVLALAVLAVACTGYSTAEECISKHAVGGPSNIVVQATILSCRNAFDDGVNEIERARAECFLDRVEELQSDRGAQLLVSMCSDEHPTPTCDAGTHFSWQSGKCE